MLVDASPSVSGKVDANDLMFRITVDIDADYNIKYDINCVLSS